MKCNSCNGLGLIHDGPERVSCETCFGTGRFVATVTYTASAGTWRRAARKAEALDHPSSCQLMRNAAFLVPDGTSVGVRVPIAWADLVRWCRHDAECSERVEAAQAAS